MQYKAKVYKMDIQSSLKLDISQYQANLNKAATQTSAAMSKISNSFSSIKNAFAGLITAAAVKGAISLAENYDNVSGTIKNATSSLTEFNAFQQSTFQAAQKLGLPFEKMAASVTALIPPMKAIGASTNTIKTFAETLQAGFKANGFKSGDSVINALAKSFNKGTIDAKAFQATLLAIPDLAANIAKNLGLTEQQVKALGVSGKLTAKDFITAVNASSEEYSKQAQNISSLSDSFNYLKNAVAQYLSGANKASGFTKILSGVVKIAADNIDKLALGFTVIAGLKIASMFQAALTPITAMGVALLGSVKAWTAETAAIMANTRAKTANAIASRANAAGLAVSGVNAAGAGVANAAGLMVGGFAGVKNAISGIAKMLGKGGILAAVAAVIALTGQWKNTVDSVKYIFNDLKGVVTGLWDSLKSGVNAISGSLKEFVNSKEYLKGFFNDFDGGIFGLFEMVGRLADNTVSGLKAVFSGIIQNTATVIKKVFNILTMPIKGLLTAVEKGFNSVFGIYNKVAEKIGLKPIELNVDFSEIKEKLTFDGDFLGIDDIKSLFKEYQSEQKQSGLEAYFRQMKADIDANRGLIDAQNKAKQAEIDGLNGFNDNLTDLNQALADKIKDTQKIGGKTATDLQIEIDKLYQNTDFNKRDDEFYRQIDDLQNAILQLKDRTIDWDKVAQAVSGIQTSSRLDLSVPQMQVDNALITKQNEQIQALQDNTAALNSMSSGNTAASERPIVVKVIGNIDNMKEFISVVFDEKIGRAALMNA